MSFKRNWFIGLALVVVIALILANQAAALENTLRLPSSTVTLEARDGENSYFDLELSQAPSGYDVQDGVYAGWCVDRSTLMQRSPATHEVYLYSSLDPPASLAGQRWDLVNYILNHKQGNTSDVQKAIWTFVNNDDNYSSRSNATYWMTKDALENGTGFTPTVGQKLAVICEPENGTVQRTIIELTVTEALAQTIVPPQEEIPNANPTNPESTPQTNPTNTVASPTPTPTPNSSAQPSTSSQPTPSPTTSSQDSNPARQTQSAATPLNGAIYAAIAAILVPSVLGIMLVFRRKIKDKRKYP